MRTKALFLVCLCMLLFTACDQDKKGPEQQAPPKVSVIETRARNVPLYMEFVGQTSGLKDIAIRARVEGFLEGLHFQEGAQIRKGDLLYTLESQPFREKVATRLSEVAAAETLLAKASGDLGRIKPLAEINAVSQSNLDEARAAQEAAIANLEAAKANLRAAEIQLGYTKIFSPINGIIGKTKAKVGDFVGRDPNPVILNTVSQVDTILVTFFITESQYLRAARHLARADKADKKERGDRKDNFELILIDGSVYEHKGNADFIDREVNTTTGAMLVQASFPNPSKILRPGQFARIKIKVEDVKDGILIPQRCVMELQGLFSVYVITAENKVETREISVGPKVGSFWLIQDGLGPGEKVVYEGLQKVKDGITVNPTLVDLKSTVTEEK